MPANTQLQGWKQLVFSHTMSTFPETMSPQTLGRLLLTAVPESPVVVREIPVRYFTSLTFTVEVRANGSIHVQYDLKTMWGQSINVSHRWDALAGWQREADSPDVVPAEF